MESADRTAAGGLEPAAAALSEDARPSDRAGPASRWTPRRVGLLSVHTTPLAQPGTGDSGGMNVTVAELGRRLAQAGIGVDVYTRATGPDLPPTVVTADGVRVHHLEAGPPGTPKDDLVNHLCAFYLALSAHPTLAELDLVHAHYWMSGWVARQLRARHGIPMVQTFHTLARAKNAALAPGDSLEPALRVAAEDRIVAAADAIIAPTADEAGLLRRCYAAAPAKLHVAPLGVDLSVFGPGEEPSVGDEGDGAAAGNGATGPAGNGATGGAGKHAGSSTANGNGHGPGSPPLGEGRVVLFVGRLQPLKGPDVAVRALAALGDDAVRLVIVGGPSGSGFGTVDPPRLRELAAQLGVADRVAFLAPRPQSELPALYRAADVVLMPSRSESFGLVALEAQACGTPVVAADVGGLRSALALGAGTLVTGHDPADYAAALVPYLRDEGRRRRAGEAGLAHSRSYGWSRVARSTVEVYRSVLGAREPASGAAGA